MEVTTQQKGKRAEFLVFGELIRGSLKGRSLFKTHPSPSPLKERGTEGVRLINTITLGR